LPEAYREPLILRLVEGMTGPEIAGANWIEARFGTRQSLSWNANAAREAE